jgi:hypothetical protein
MQQPPLVRTPATAEVTVRLRVTLAVRVMAEVKAPPLVTLAVRVTAKPMTAAATVRRSLVAPGWVTVTVAPARVKGVQPSNQAPG